MVSLEPPTVIESEAALAEIVALDRGYGRDLDALGVLLLRTESVASFKIEYVEASPDDDYARALQGSRANQFGHVDGRRHVLTVDRLSTWYLLAAGVSGALSFLSFGVWLYADIRVRKLDRSAGED